MTSEVTRVDIWWSPSRRHHTSGTRRSVGLQQRWYFTVVSELSAQQEGQERDAVAAAAFYRTNLS